MIDEFWFPSLKRGIKPAFALRQAQSFGEARGDVGRYYFDSKCAYGRILALCLYPIYPLYPYDSHISIIKVRLANLKLDEEVHHQVVKSSKNIDYFANRADIVV